MANIEAQNNPCVIPECVFGAAPQSVYCKAHFDCHYDPLCGFVRPDVKFHLVHVIVNKRDVSPKRRTVTKKKSTKVLKKGKKKEKKEKKAKTKPKKPPVPRKRNVLVKKVPFPQPARKNTVPPLRFALKAQPALKRESDLPRQIMKIKEEPEVILKRE
jgi:hypothetical protein